MFHVANIRKISRSRIRTHHIAENSPTLWGREGVIVFQKIIFFLFVFPPVWLLALYISPTFFLRLPVLIPCHFLPYRQSYPPPLENLTAAILSYAVSHLRSLKKKLHAQRFDMQAADRWSPIQVLTQQKAA